jgi:uncharacterized protein
MSGLHEKYKGLKAILEGMKTVLVAYSGGVDSTFLLKAALDTLGKERVLAVTARSATYPEAEWVSAKETAAELGARHRVIDTCELEKADFVKNTPERCYYCKKEFFGELKAMADKEGIRFIIDGTNHDDLSDHRPGMRAAEETGVESPLMEAGLKKDDIRKLSKEFGLKTWNKSHLACLASRFPYGLEMTEQRLKKVDRAETYLRKLGFKELRARHYEETVRIELGKEEMKMLFEDRGLAEKIVKGLKEIGYVYITLDLEGFQSGSMNRVLCREKQIP